ncbi:hypothetical protein B0H19DRAFT_1152286 [Mycena capillaripes]|nr:hypothetical protein B0H19DRAFT_1152286 [Mycena capillaripes]
MSNADEALPMPDALLDTHYSPPLGAKIFHIPQNWHESWDSLRTTLAQLEQSGFDPHSAVFELTHAETIREDVSAVDNPSVAHLQPHLRTNYVPTASERKTIQQYCAEGKKKLTRLSELVHRDRLRLARSSARLAKMKELFDPYLELLSPVRAMPPEILQEIFVACLPAHHCAIMHPSHIPLLLGRVCSGWRRIWLSTPALWSSVHVVVPSSDGDRGPQVLREACESLKTWLQRSGDCSLSISIFVPTSFDSNLPPFVEIIVPYSRRWKSLRLMPATREQLPALWNLRSEDVPLLETLEISDNLFERPDLHALRFLTVPRNLRHLTVKHFQGEVSIPACRWEQLTSLCLESQRSFFTLDTSQLVELVGQCTNLINCRLVFPIGSPVPLTVASTPAPPQISLSRLQTLSMTGEVTTNAPFNIVDILDTLALPALQQLQLTGIAVMDFNNPITVQAPAVSDVLLAVDELITRSSCDLQELTIQFAAGDVGALLRCLQRCDRLTRLDLHYSPIYQQEPANLTPVIAALADSGTSSSGHLCPDLRNLRLAYCDHTAAAHPILRTLIERRCGSTPPGLARLNTVDLFLSCETSLDSAEIQAAAHPSEVSIAAPIRHFSRAAAATWGIPHEV